jgi:hypothetical protein
VNRERREGETGGLRAVGRQFVIIRADGGFSVSAEEPASHVGRLQQIKILRQ